MTWTHFWDMHSGGGQKLDWPHIYIEAPQAEAERVFYHRFHRNPNRVTCTCCGEDYAINEAGSLDELTEYHRTRKRQSVAAYLAEAGVKVIQASEIAPHEREGELPDEGYVWAGDA